jgi:hypothetical protein
MSEPDERTTESSGERVEDERVDADHLDDLEPGAGCAEIWEHLSERRERAQSD